jgi:hypothetical protein
MTYRDGDFSFVSRHSIAPSAPGACASISRDSLRANASDGHGILWRLRLSILSHLGNYNLENRAAPIKRHNSERRDLLQQGFELSSNWESFMFCSSVRRARTCLSARSRNAWILAVRSESAICPLRAGAFCSSESFRELAELFVVGRAKV